MKTAKMTIRLPQRELDTAKMYAASHNLSLTALVVRYFERLQIPDDTEIPPEIAPVAGTLPPNVDVCADYIAGMEARHS